MQIAYEEQALCTTCGMCCDGTLFDFTPLKTIEQAQFEASENGILPLGDGRLALPQPCRHLKNKCCDIYEKGRPGICGEYKCKLLKNFLRDEITYSSARDLIQETLNQRDQIRERLEKSVGITGLNLRELFKAWTEMQTEESQKTIEVSQLSLDYVALQFHLRRNFKK